MRKNSTKPRIEEVHDMSALHWHEPEAPKVKEGDVLWTWDLCSGAVASLRVESNVAKCPACAPGTKPHFRFSYSRRNAWLPWSLEGFQEALLRWPPKVSEKEARYSAERERLLRDRLRILKEDLKRETESRQRRIASVQAEIDQLYKGPV